MSSIAARSTRVSLREAFAAASRKKKPLLSSKKKKAATRRSIAAASDSEEEQPEEGQEGLTSTDALEAVAGMRSASAAAAEASRERSPAERTRSAAKPASTARVEEASRFARKEPRATDLREYDGASGDKLDAWLDELGAAVELFELNEREAVRFAASRLREAARQWWNSLGADGKVAVDSREALAKAMRTRFQPVTAAHTARVQLDKLAQGSRSVNEYIADFQRLRTRLPDMAEADALHAFKRGLRDDIATDLRKQRVATLAEAISLAAHVGSDGSVAAPKSSLRQLEAHGGGDDVTLEERIERAVLNAMQGRDTSGMSSNAHTGYTQQRKETQRGGRGGFRGGRGRGGRGFGQRSGPPVVPGVPEEVVRQRLDAQQCVRCGGEGHYSAACPHAISARGN